MINLKCTFAVTAGLCSSLAYAQKQPHIILIMTDQQRGDAMGCMGNESLISPHLDALASEGTLFMNGYSSCPSSTPARAGLLTGQSPWHHGLLGYGKVAPKYNHEMPTYWTGEMACQMIQNYDNGNQPLFLKVSFARPHSPYDPPQRFLDMYKDAQVPDPVIGEWCGKYAKELDPEKAAKDAPYGNFGNEYARHSKRYYYANITFIDEQIGRVLQTLKDKGMYDNSLIIFVSDHGDMMGDHYHWRKTYPYEGSTHIPYIIKWPAKAQVVPGKVDNPVELRDLLPTFFEIAGTSVPTDIDGRSLLSLAKGTETEWRKYIDLEHATCYSDDNYWCALTDGKIKYIWYFYTGEEQLFDLAKDPKELHNAVNDKKYKKLLTGMRAEMIRHLSERGEEFVKDGQLVVRKKTMLYGPNYPKEKR